MKSLVITDNKQDFYLKQLIVHGESISEVFNDLLHIANTKLGELAKNNPSLLILPTILSSYNDDIDKLHVCDLSGSTDKPLEIKITTGNLMGFIGYGNTQLTITSRFAKEEEDFFLHYMLQKVGAIHLFNLQHSSNDDKNFDFLIYLFPMMLKKAVSQGIFKTYKTFKRNDANVKGTIDVARHIRENIPFTGKVAYNSRERTFDNEITELIRHTIEVINTKPCGKAILSSDTETKSAVSSIFEATPSYNPHERNQIIAKNIKPLNHPYFTAYKPLQKLCLAILRHKKLKYKNDSKQVYGILFDGSWLWEEYLWTILQNQGFKHPKNKERSEGIRMFKNNDDENFDKNYRKIYPDFYTPKNNNNGWILDAKYKHLENGAGREDLYQVVTYMHTMKIGRGGFIYPSTKNEDFKHLKLANEGGTISILGFPIPQTSESFSDFANKMGEIESKLLDRISKLCYNSAVF